MKNISLALNIVLLVAVGVLYYLFFTKTSNESGTQVIPMSEAGSRISSIAYVNSDSLLEKYEFFKNEADKLEKKRKKMETDFSSRAKGLQNEIAQFQNAAQSMTMNQARAMEEELMKKQQNLMQYQEGLSQEIMKAEAKVNSDLYDKLSQYLKEYGKERNLEVVLTYTKGSGVLYAKDSLDITNQVVEGLNKAYKAEVTQVAEMKGAKKAQK